MKQQTQHQRMMDFFGRHIQKNGTSRRQVIIYPAKCLLGMALIFPLFICFPNWRQDVTWMLVSLMLSITHDDDNKVGIDRIKGNIIGSMTGCIAWLLMYALTGGRQESATDHMVLFIALALGIIVIIVACAGLDMIATARTALVAFVIVMIYEGSRGSWQGAFGRMLSVIAGCLLGLLINRLFSSKDGRTSGDRQAAYRKSE